MISELYKEVTQEYVRRLLRGEVKLRDREHQQKAFMTVMDNAESLHKLFTKMVRFFQHHRLKFRLCACQCLPLKNTDEPEHESQSLKRGFCAAFFSIIST